MSSIQKEKEEKEKDKKEKEKEKGNVAMVENSEDKLTPPAIPPHTEYYLQQSPVRNFPDLGEDYTVPDLFKNIEGSIFGINTIFIGTPTKSFPPFFIFYLLFIICYFF